MDDLNNIRQFLKPLKDLAKWKEDLDNIKESVKPLENLAKWMDSAGVVSPPSNSIKVQTDVQNDTREKMQMLPNEPGNQMANIRGSYLEISDITLSEDDY